MVISNVPGPREARYLNGALLLEQYPMSMLIDGQALNITVTSHDDRLDFGVLACPNAVEDPQHVADLLEGALAELEQAPVSALIAKKSAAKKTSRKKAGVRKVSTAKTVAGKR